MKILKIYRGKDDHFCWWNFILKQANRWFSGKHWASTFHNADSFWATSWIFPSEILFPCPRSKEGKVEEKVNCFAGKTVQHTHTHTCRWRGQRRKRKTLSFFSLIIGQEHRQRGDKVKERYSQEGKETGWGFASCQVVQGESIVVGGGGGQDKSRSQTKWESVKRKITGNQWTN